MTRIVIAAALGVLSVSATNVAADGPELQDRRNAVSRSARNDAVELTVTGFTVTHFLGTHGAPQGGRYVVLETRWKNVIPLKRSEKRASSEDVMGAGGIGFGAVGGEPAKNDNARVVMLATAYQIPAIAEHAFLVINGDDPVRISDSHPTAAHALPLDAIEIPKLDAVVQGELVFAIPEHGVKSLALLYLDSSYGNVRLDLFGTAPAPTRATATAANDLVEVAAYGVEERTEFDGNTAPAGKRFAVVKLGIRGKSERELVRFVLQDHAAVRDNDHRFPVAREATGLGGLLELVPTTTRRGELVFHVDESHGPLTLAVDVPGYQPIRLALQPGASRDVESRPARPALFRIQDGETLDVYVQGARRASAIGTVPAEPGMQFVVLDITLVNRVDSGIEFQTGEQLKLLSGTDEFRADPIAIQNLAHPLVEGTVVNPHDRTSYEVAFRVPVSARRLTLHYRGFNKEEKRDIDVR